MSAANEYLKAGEPCECCSEPAKVGDTVWVFGIGGGYAHLCELCYEDEQEDRRYGQGSYADPDYEPPECVDAIVVAA